MHLETPILITLTKLLGQILIAADLTGNREVGNKIEKSDNPFEESHYKVELCNKEAFARGSRVKKHFFERWDMLNCMALSIV